MFLSRKYYHQYSPASLHKLQWGRDVSIPEITPLTLFPTILLYFNGAGMFLSRKLAGKIQGQRGWQASMGPGCFYPGNQIPQPFISCGGLLQWGRDVSIPEISQPFLKPYLPYCFNGAGMFLSRKCYRRVSRSAVLRCFNGAGMFLSRKLRAVWIRGRKESCFNGAGMFLSRKLSVAVLLSSCTVASMGPGCFYPGNGAKAWARSVDFSASMGPGCFYPGNEVTGADMLLLTLLQWGRDVSIPEIP